MVRLSGPALLHHRERGGGRGRRLDDGRRGPPDGPGVRRLPRNHGEPLLPARQGGWRGAEHRSVMETQEVAVEEPQRPPWDWKTGHRSVSQLKEYSPEHGGC